MDVKRRDLLKASGAIALLGPVAGLALESPRHARALVLHAGDAAGAAFAGRLRTCAPHAACTALTLAGLTAVPALWRLLARHAGGLLIGLVGDDTAPLVNELARDRGARAVLLAHHVESRGRVRHAFPFVAAAAAARAARAPRSDWVHALADAHADVLGGRALPADVVARMPGTLARGTAGGYESFIYHL